MVSNLPKFAKKIDFINVFTFISNPSPEARREFVSLIFLRAHKKTRVDKRGFEKYWHRNDYFICAFLNMRFSFSSVLIDMAFAS